MHRRSVPAVLVLAFAFAATASVGCRRERAAEAPPPPPPVPAPPPPPCDVLGNWQALPPLPLGPQQFTVAPGDRPGVFYVRALNGQNLGVATIQTTTGMPVDTQVTNPIYQCTVGPDCNTMTCAFSGGAAPSTFKRIQ